MAEVAPRSRSPLVAVTGLPGAEGAVAVAAAVGIAGARTSAEKGAPRGAVLCEAGAAPRRPTLLAAPAARELERRARPRLPAAARGSLCWIALGAPAHEGLESALGLGAGLVVAVLPPADWRELVAVGTPDAVVLRADLARARPLAALIAIELRRLRIPVGVVTRAPGRVAARRAQAGIDPGGELAERALRLSRRLLHHQEGQALPLVLGVALLTIIAAAVIAMLGAAATGASRLQRAADLTAVSAASSMRDDYSRLFVPARTPAGAANPRYLDEGEYRLRARAAATRALRANAPGTPSLGLTFPGGGLAPTRVRITLVGRPSVEDGTPQEFTVSATAEAYPVASGAAAPAMASGGGYSGPLAYRQGEPMRPDVAAAFDRLFAAARAAGHALTINSAFRSDAEQAALFAANPDPRWVAPPGKSLHRCATELDLGPASAYGWLAANADRFGFLRRYSWEPWHFGYVKGPPPCSAAAASPGRARRAGDGARSRRGLPDYVPRRFRAAIAQAAARWNVSPGLLAAQLLAESGFNPLAVSPAGAQGIAQFMPATAAAYGLRDPFDLDAAINAQARLMTDLLAQFGDVGLALAAYNAGPGAVAACNCVPPYPETQAYVARILGLMGGAGSLAPPQLEVRLVR